MGLDEAQRCQLPRRAAQTASPSVNANTTVTGECAEFQGSGQPMLNSRLKASHQQPFFLPSYRSWPLSSLRRAPGTEEPWSLPRRELAYEGPGLILFTPTLWMARSWLLMRTALSNGG
jgi:hypothetical protein